MSTIDKRQEALNMARTYAMSDKERTKDERHLLLGELIMFVWILFPDHEKE